MSVMQFHLNGFIPGDPHHLYQKQDAEPIPWSEETPKNVDVLISGCGPAGLALAAQLSKFPSITTLIFDQKPGRLTIGQADGLQCRSLEMFEAFGFSDRVLKEAYWVNETTFWKPDPKTGDIVRSGRIRDTEEGLSEFPHVILNQARVHDFFLDVMRDSPTRLSPCYSRRMKMLKVVEDGDANEDAQSTDQYPVEVKLERTDPGHEREIETVHAKYVVGCDGARSSVREALGLQLKGDFANQAWGVMDVLAVTNFPDWRTKAAIHSADQGSILIIPREGGYLVRLYIELDKLDKHERVADRKITSETLINTAKRIFHPYILDVKEVAWWSVYEIGQRLCNKFDNTSEGADQSNTHPRIFIAGDACHTHSPKAGQGMNVSMQDTFNLGWKLASVLQKLSHPKVLHTYSSERQAIAQELITFDREIARMFSAKPKSSENDTEGIDPAEFQKYFEKQGRFTAGMGTCYTPSLITASTSPENQDLAKGFPVGRRFHSAMVTRLADAKPLQLGHIVKADGRWRIFIFMPEFSTSACLFHSLTSFFDSPSSPLKKYTSKGADIDSIVDTRAIFQEPHSRLDINTMPSFLWPQKGRYLLHDYEKIFCAEEIEGKPDIFEQRGVDRNKGCLVVVRPDQYVAGIWPLDGTGFEALAGFFDGFMVCY